MLIRARLFLIGFLPALLLLALGGAYLVSQNHLDVLKEKTALADQLGKKLFELTVISHDLLALKSVRPQQQWSVIMQDVQTLLPQAKAAFTGADESELLELFVEQIVSSQRDFLELAQWQGQDTPTAAQQAYMANLIQRIQANLDSALPITGKIYSIDNQQALLFAERQKLTMIALLILLCGAIPLIVWPMMRHITRATTELAAQEVKFRTVADYTYDWEYWEGPQRQLLHISPSCERITGYSRAGFMADPELLYSIIHPEDRHLMEAHIHDPTVQEEATIDFRIVRWDGDVRWIAHGCRAVHGADGEYLGRRASNRDITGRKDAEKQLHQSESLQRAIIENEPECVKLLDAEGTLLMMNKAGLGMIEANSAQVIGKKVLGILVPEYREPFMELTRRVFEGDSGNLEFEVVGLKGRRCWLDTHAVPLRNQEGQITALLGITRDITQRKQAEAELEQHRHHLEALVEERTAALSVAKEGAEAANRAKSVFLANMSHELRTPLNAILGFAQLMERDDRLPDEVRNNLRTINRSGRGLLALINDVLEISKIEAGRLQANSGTIDLPDLLGTLTESMALRAREKGLALRLDVPATLPRHIDSDIAKLRQILLNLLSNAVKYTRQGEIVLSANIVSPENHPLTLEFAVRDSGDGIAAAELERIFGAFYQTEAGIRQGEGTGLGLTISREFAHLLGGELTADSIPGQGSVFRLKLPVNLAAAPETPPVQGHVRALSPGQPDYRVLIVEDEPVNQEVLKMWLDDVGFSVKVANDGRQAVELFQQWQPHFIWMDMRMPVMDGFEATRAIRALPGGAELPIVAFTAAAFEEDRRAILAAGCNDVMTKPLEEDRLFELMARYLKVRFDYDAAPVAEPAAVDFGVLPAPTLERLRQAAVDGHARSIRDLALELNGDFPLISQRLRELADAYRFDVIIEGIRATASKR